MAVDTWVEEAVGAEGVSGKHCSGDTERHRASKLASAADTCLDTENQDAGQGVWRKTVPQMRRSRVWSDDTYKGPPEKRMRRPAMAKGVRHLEQRAEGRWRQTGVRPPPLQTGDPAMAESNLRRMS